MVSCAGYANSLAKLSSQDSPTPGTTRDVLAYRMPVVLRVACRLVDPRSLRAKNNPTRRA